MLGSLAKIDFWHGLNFFHFRGLQMKLHFFTSVLGVARRPNVIREISLEMLNVNFSVAARTLCRAS
jgi:hypothetical protein